MIDTTKISFGIKLVIALTIVFCISTLNLSHAQTFYAKRVIDGDTLQLTNGEIIRLIGVGTPETKHPPKPIEYYGKEAYAFTRKMVEGKRHKIVQGGMPCKKYYRLS
jgi:micrococcal nuclease